VVVGSSALLGLLLMRRLTRPATEERIISATHRTAECIPIEAFEGLEMLHQLSENWRTLRDENHDRFIADPPKDVLNERAEAICLDRHIANFGGGNRLLSAERVGCTQDGAIELIPRALVEWSINEPSLREPPLDARDHTSWPNVKDERRRQLARSVR